MVNEPVWQATAVNKGFVAGAPGTSASVRLGIKRLFDVTFAAISLAAVGPLITVVALFIWLDSPGFPFYADLRCGRDGRPFRMVKLRTMYVGAQNLQSDLTALNQAESPLFKLKTDPRITRFGRVLRRWSIDEVPQLANVLLGHMSFIGPRPFVVQEAAVLNAMAEGRTAMRPGMSGPWQVSGRARLPTPELIRLDLEYVQSWSLRRDVHLLAQTVRAVLSGNGAY